MGPLASFRPGRCWPLAAALLALAGPAFSRGEDVPGPARPDPVVARLYGREITRSALLRLKEQRQIADLFMRRSLEEAIRGLRLHFQQVRRVADPRARQRSLLRLTELLQDLGERSRRPHYFEGGTGLHDLLDFLLWRHEADRLKVEPGPAEVARILRRELHADEAGFGGDAARRAREAVRAEFPGAGDDAVAAALRQEYRAALARFVLLEARPWVLLAPDRVDLWFRAQVRQPLTPAQLWDYYRRWRAPCDVALLPVEVAPFARQVRAPTRKELEDLFRRYRAARPDPASDRPGFVRPEQVKVQWVTADPRSAHYRRLARAVGELEATPPVAWFPTPPGLGQAVCYAAGPVARQTSLGRIYEAMCRAQPYLFADTPLSRPYSALALYTRLYGRPAPEVAASVVGVGLAPTSAAGLDPLALEAVSAPALWQAAACRAKAGELGPVVEKEVARRWPVGATLVLSAADPLPLQTAALWTAAGMERQFLPLAALEPELRKRRELILAAGWTGDVMQTVKKVLERQRGRGPALEAELAALAKKYPGLEVRQTTRFRSRFDVDRDPNLAGLLRSFERYRDEINLIEGRNGSGRELTEDDFHRLFFGGEPFSAGKTGPYNPRIWPPVVTVNPRQLRLAEPDPAASKPRTVNLWQAAESPVLFWKTESRPERVPETLGEVRPEVERAWRLGRARAEIAVPRARQIAAALHKLQTRGQDLRPEMERLAAGLNARLIRLDGVTALVPVGRGDFVSPEWRPYELPRGPFPYPAEDMAKEILSLRDLGAPIKIQEKGGEGVARRLNEANRGLFDGTLPRRAPGAHQVQILTNRPRTVFYVAVVVEEYQPSPLDFREVWLMSLLGRYRPGESLIDRAQEEAGRAHRRAFLEQLRRAARLWVNERHVRDDGP